jgi:alpha-beta hydrolase superfamily lysophospholipase
VGERINLTTEDGLHLDAVWRESGEHVVVLAHGLTVDLEENGLFGPLADALAQRGLSTLRFSFRGHGRSAGLDRNMTIAGELLDLRAAVEWPDRPVSVLGSSFGAVSVALSCPALEDALRAVVLWQPVLDLRRTFLEPELRTGRELYGGRVAGEPHHVDGRFVLGAALFDEFAVRWPRDAFLATSVPALVVHGDADTHVSHDIARDTALRRWGTDWHSIAGAEHGFVEPAAAQEVIEVTADWLAENG